MALPRCSGPQLDVGESGKRLVEITPGLAVGSVGGVVPGIDEVLGLDVGAVLELVPGLSLTVKCWFLCLDRLRDVVSGAAFSVLYCTSFDVMASTMSPPHARSFLPGMSGFSGVQPATVISPPAWVRLDWYLAGARTATATRRRNENDRRDGCKGHTASSSTHSMSSSNVRHSWRS